MSTSPPAVGLKVRSLNWQGDASASCVAAAVASHASPGWERQAIVGLIGGTIASSMPSAVLTASGIKPQQDAIGQMLERCPGAVVVRNGVRRAEGRRRGGERGGVAMIPLRAVRSGA